MKGERWRVARGHLESLELERHGHVATTRAPGRESAQGGLEAIQASDDPLIQWMLSIQDVTRGVRSECLEDFGPAAIGAPARSGRITRFACEGRPWQEASRGRALRKR